MGKWKICFANIINIYYIILYILNKENIIQTFLPYKDFKATACILDYKRLGKQRVECKQIYQALTNQGSLRWKSHPAVKMWEGCESSLLKYGIAICSEWKSRNYKDTVLDYFLFELNKYSEIIYPKWLGNNDLHKSHQSNLLRKFNSYYSIFFKDVSDNLEYVWPL